MATWPGTLPTNWASPDFAESEADNLIRTNMDVGPAKVRRRSTSAPRIHSGSMNISEAQYATLKTFYQTTLGYGALNFTMPDAHGTDRDMRFLSPPSYVYEGYNWWRVQLIVEEL